MKKVITEKGQEDTLYTRNFDGMPARTMKTPHAVALTRRPMSFPETTLRALRSARAMGLPLRQVARSLVTRLDRTRLLSYFGAAIPLVERATIEGDVETGVQFIGQSQGLVGDVPSVEELIARIVDEADQARAAIGAVLGRPAAGS